VRAAFEKLLAAQFPRAAAPYSDDQFRALFVRCIFADSSYYLGLISLLFFQYRQFDWNFTIRSCANFAKLVNDPLQGVAGLMAQVS
jgi:hypothetical protein